MNDSDGEMPDGEDVDAGGKAVPCFVSSDGLLALTIVEDIDGERLIGFHGFDWKVQVSALSEISGLSHEDATRSFIEDVLGDRSMIAVLSTHGEVTDVWITESPEIDLEYLKGGETLLFRYWSGTVIDVDGIK